MVSVFAAVAAAAAVSLQANDVSASEQWAFYNDGSFYLEEEKNQYYVYDDPFGEPAGPGAWNGWLGIRKTTEQKNAVSGIDINLAEAWEQYGTGTHGTIVAMIDTGVDPDHEDLKGALWVNADEIPDNGIDDDGNGYVDDVNGWNFYGNNNCIFSGEEDSHGTHGAGTILANTGNEKGVCGMVPGNQVKIMPLKMLGGSMGSGSTATLIRAIRYAEENGAMICNLSLATNVDDPVLYEVMKNSCMLFIVAAGNAQSLGESGVNIDESPVYPAAYDLDNMIVVANLTCDGTLNSTSNYGRISVDLAAPGTNILSTAAGNRYGYMTGTSMAAPMVTGTAAMVYSAHDGIGMADVKEILLATVKPLESLSEVTATGGMLDAGAALSYDIRKLTRTGFRNGGNRNEAGSPPIIESRITVRGADPYLVLRVVDVDGDLDTMLFAEGAFSADQMRESAQARPFSVNAQDQATFRISKQGVYTFYARDGAGNETVKLVFSGPEEAGPGMYNLEKQEDGYGKVKIYTKRDKLDPV